MDNYIKLLCPEAPIENESLSVPHGTSHGQRNTRDSGGSADDGSC